MSKFYYITFKGTQKKQDVEEDTFETNPLLQRYVEGYTILPLVSFIPSMIVDIIQKRDNLENVIITGSIEMTAEEFSLNQEYIENKYRLDTGTVNEINSLIDQTESGNLRVIVDPDDEKPFNDDPFSAGDFFK